MTRKRKLFLTVGAVGGVIIVGGVIHDVRQRRQRAEHQRIYQAAFASLSEAVKSGMTREDVQNVLRQRSTVFYKRSGQVTDEIVTLGRESSPYWYCSYEDIIVRVPFKRARPSADFEPRLDDIAQAPILDIWLRDCL